MLTQCRVFHEQDVDEKVLKFLNYEIIMPVRKIKTVNYEVLEMNGGKVTV